MGVLDYHRDFLESLPVAVYAILAPTGTLLFWNKRAVELWGREPKKGDLEERFCGSHKIFLPDGTYVPHAECPMATAIETGRSFTNQVVCFEHPDGSTRSVVMVNISPIRDNDGRVVGAINVFHPIDPPTLAAGSSKPAPQDRGIESCQ